MNCLCCGKPLESGDMEGGWHKKCVRSFFGSTVLPELEIDEETLARIAAESCSKGFTVPGVQKKLSLHLKKGTGGPRLTLVNYPSGYILKPQVEEYSAMPEAEHLVMSMAEIAGIKTVPHALLNGKNGYAYITKRVDRILKPGKVGLLAMEDFCQLDLRMTQDKYKGSYERCAKIVERYSARSGLDETELFLRIVFSFLVGNSDMHLKNFSLIETVEGSGEYVLSPAYDLLPVNLIMPADKEQFALSMNGKKKNIREKDFKAFAACCNLPEKVSSRMLEKLGALQQTFTYMVEGSLLPDEMKKKFLVLMKARFGVL